MVDPVTGFLFGIVAIGIPYILSMIHYERYVKGLKAENEHLKREGVKLWNQVEAAHKKMMAVDYEKLAMAEMQARSLATVTANQRLGEYDTPEIADLDIFDLQDYKVNPNAE